MPYKREFFTRAAMTVQKRKNANTAESARRREEIHAAVPAVYELDAQIAKQYTKIVRCVTEHMPAEQVRARMSEIETRTKQLRAQRAELLKQAGKPAGYLDVIFTCETCGDSGLVSDGYCGCLLREVKKLAAAEINRSAGMNLTRFEDFDLKRIDTAERDIMSAVLQRCREYARDFSPPSAAGLYMYGHPGVGKTHLSLAIAGAVIEKGYSVAYGSAPDLFRSVEKEHFGKKDSAGEETADSDSVLDTLMTVDLLILDDVGAEFRSAFYDSVLYNILNTRGNRRLPLIISSNLFPSAAEEKYDERIFSRLSALELLPFLGGDLRRSL